MKTIATIFIQLVCVIILVNTSREKAYLDENEIMEIMQTILSDPEFLEQDHDAQNKILNSIYKFILIKHLKSEHFFTKK